jgi:hypothetical protein
MIDHSSNLFVGKGFLEFFHLIDGFESFDDGEVGVQNFLRNVVLVDLIWVWVTVPE